MNLRALLMPYDVYERHTVVGRLLQEALGQTAVSRILDVGGRTDLLSHFLPYPVLTVNPDGTGHVLGSGVALPFADASVDAVVNIDTLEHLPTDRRLPFLQECLRVSGRFVVVAAPYGSAAHMALERELNELHRQIVGHPHPYLAEHVAYGLPSPAQIEAISTALAPATVKLYYAGDFAWQGASFRRAVQMHRQQRPLALLTNLYNRISGMALFHPIRLTRQPNERTNRCYLFITK